MSPLGLLAHLWGNAVGAEDHSRALRNLFVLFHKDRAFGGQLFHYVAIVDNLLADVNGRTVEPQGQLHYVDGSDHPSAKAPWLEQVNDLVFGRNSLMNSHG